MIIRSVLKKGTDHPVNCEDDLFFSIAEPYYIGAIFDGCSTGKKSHFASNLYSKILNKVLNTKTYQMFDDGDYSLEDIAKQTFVKFFNKLKKIKHILSLNDLEILSTFIVAIVKNNQAYIIVSGDGCIVADDKEIKLESIENAPDYLAYHLNEKVFDVYENNIKKFKFDNIQNGLSICSDGIYSFRNPDSSKAYSNVIEDLLYDKKLIDSEAMLARKYNILTNSKNGFSNYDDLSIVRFVY
ncbi:protein phosphatase 2C domain-containing protein [Candidatus Dojkabacteria bacterium]|jgi:serine/threonine protein phosphatase PrpC|nr:protein phosphatase 2C domain-containing protein [Candidatus Dojkabacteria bacterium]